MTCSMTLVFVGSLLYGLLVDMWGEQPLGTDFISNEVEVWCKCIQSL